MGRGLSDPYVVLCKVRLVGAWIKRRDDVDDVGGKLLNGIKSMYVNNLACVRVK